MSDVRVEGEHGSFTVPTEVEAQGPEAIKRYEAQQVAALKKKPAPPEKE